MRTSLKITAVSSTILLLFLFATDPQKIPSALLIAPFILLFVAIASGVPFVLGAQQLSRRKTVKIGVVVAAISVILLGLQSLGQLTVRDVLAVTILFGVAYFYASRFGLRFTN